MLGNMPLFYHKLKSLGSAKHVADIYVNTDSEKIKELLRKDFPKVVIIDRPPELLGDKSPDDAYDRIWPEIHKNGAFFTYGM